MPLRYSSLAVAVAALAAGASDSAQAQAKRANPDDAATIEQCLDAQRGKNGRLERCIGAVADPCLEQKEAQTTAGMVACFNRELLVWDDMLNRTYEQLRLKLENPQWVKLRDSQRVWLESRKQTCEFYWEFFRGTMAGPIAESCYARETAQRALYLDFFLDPAK